MAVAADAFLVVGFALLILMLFVVNIYVIAYYQHPDDKNNSYYAKILIMFGFMLTTLSVLMIPVDVGNNEGDPSCDLNQSNTYCGGINILAVYQSLFCMICFVVVGIIPFATFYYEGSGVDGPDKGRFCTALVYEMVVVFSFIVVLVPLYFTSGETSIPVTDYQYDLLDITENTYTDTINKTPYQFIDLTVPLPEFNNVNKKTDQFVIYSVTFPVYLIALAGWIGWWLFSVFAGVGLAALPFDYILAYIYRPRLLPPDEFAQRELELQERTNDLLDLSRLLKRDHELFMGGSASKRDKRKRNVADQLEVNKLVQMAYILEKDVEALQACKNFLKEYNPLIPYFKLIGGIFFGCISLLWLLHIILYILTSPPASKFLNSYLISFDTFFPMFGNVSYALLSLYLLFCTIVGCFKVGLRFLCIKIHIMEANKTYTNSFLFNLAIMMICTIPVIHFCTIALAGYARNTDAYLLFNIYIRYLHFYESFYQNNVFPYIMLLSAGVTLLYLLWRPTDRAVSVEQFKQSLYRRGSNGGGNYSEIATNDRVSGDNPLRKGKKS